MAYALFRSRFSFFGARDHVVQRSKTHKKGYCVHNMHHGLVFCRNRQQLIGTIQTLNILVVL